MFTAILALVIIAFVSINYADPIDDYPAAPLGKYVFNACFPLDLKN